MWVVDTRKGDKYVCIDDHGYVYVGGIVLPTGDSVLNVCSIGIGEMDIHEVTLYCPWLIVLNGLSRMHTPTYWVNTEN